MARIEMEPPEIVKYRRPKARLTKNNRREINEYGLNIPSKRSKNYEPNINETALLINTRTGYNYRKNAQTKRNAARKLYMEQRAKLAALPPVTPKKNNNNGTRKTLF
jgi:hypothetical protein